MHIAPRVVYWDNLPAPYAVERYNALADRGTIDFSVWFARRSDPDRSWEVKESDWRFKGAYIEDPSQGLEAAHRFARRCDEVRPDLVLSLYGERQFVVGHAILKALGIRTAVLVLPTFDTWIQRAWWKELAKAILFRSADAAKVPGPDGLQYAVRYGFPDERVFSVTQSVNVVHYARLLSAEERRRERARIGVDGCVFLYVGRFWSGKGLSVLLDAFRHAKSAHRAMSLWLVGDGPDEEALTHAARDIEGVTFRPFVQARELPAYYGAADVFVFPTLGDPHGQVIEEAHAAGLPVITSDAAGDIRRRVSDGTTGFVVPAGDAARLAQRMLELANDPDLRRSMGARGAQRASLWGHDVWAADFERFVSASLALPRRATLAARVMSAAGTCVVSAARVTARAKIFAAKVATTGALPAVRATIVARLNRLGLWMVSCPWRLGRPREVLSKFGSMYGGWVLPMGLLTPAGVCYCAGVGEDTSLEDELLRRTDCRVWSFDPTPRSIAHVAEQTLNPERFQFIDVGVWDSPARMRFFAPGDSTEVSHSLVHGRDIDSFFEAPCTTVAALMRQLGHDALMLLKLNIEGAEWRVLQHVLDEQLPVRILCVEFCQSPAFWRVAAMVRTLRRAGYTFLSRERWKFTFARTDALHATGQVEDKSHAA